MDEGITGLIKKNNLVHETLAHMESWRRIIPQSIHYTQSNPALQKTVGASIIILLLHQDSPFNSGARSKAKTKFKKKRKRENRKVNFKVIGIFNCYSNSKKAVVLVTYVLPKASTQQYNQNK